MRSVEGDYILLFRVPKSLHRSVTNAAADTGKRATALIETVCLMFATLEKSLVKKSYMNMWCQMFRAESHAKCQTCENTTSGSRKDLLDATGRLVEVTG